MKLNQKRYTEDLLCFMNNLFCFLQPDYEKYIIK